MFDKAFSGFGLNAPKAQLNLYIPTLIRVCDTPGSMVQTPYILLVSKEVTDADGHKYCAATLPGRTMRPWLDEYIFDRRRGINRFSPRLGANHLLNEGIGIDTNNIAQQKKDKAKQRVANRCHEAPTTKGSIQANQNIAALNKPSITNLYFEDVRKLGEDTTGTLHPGAETKFFYANLSLSLSGLPVIAPIESLDDIPDHLTSKNIASVNAVRTHAQWFRLADVISGIRQNFPGKPFMEHPDELRPQYSLEGIQFDSMRDLVDKRTYIEVASVYGLVLLAKSTASRTVNKDDAINPDTGMEWITMTDIKEHLKTTNPKAHKMLKSKFTRIPNAPTNE